MDLECLVGINRAWLYKDLQSLSLTSKCQVSVERIVLDLESVELLDTFQMKQTKMYVCTLVEFIRWSALLDVQVGTEDIQWNYIGFLYNRNNGWDMWELLLDDNWQAWINRITIAWETVTWVN